MSIPSGCLVHLALDPEAVARPYGRAACGAAVPRARLAADGALVTCDQCVTLLSRAPVSAVAPSPGVTPSLDDGSSPRSEAQDLGPVPTSSRDAVPDEDGSSKSS